MTLKNCSPADWWADGAALPTAATLRLEWQHAEAEHAALTESGIDWQTCGKPDDWACPPPCDECGGVVLENLYCDMGHWCGPKAKTPRKIWPPCEACHDSGQPCGLCGGGGYGDAQ